MIVYYLRHTPEHGDMFRLIARPEEVQLVEDWCTDRFGATSEWAIYPEFIGFKNSDHSLLFRLEFL